MNRRKLGPRGPEVSALGFGCMRFPTVDGKIDRPASTAMLEKAIDEGVDYLDTAWPYHDGESETFIADAVTGSRRDAVKIASKLPTWLVESTADLDKYFDAQRKRLRSDMIDVYLLHALDTERWKKMQEFGALDWLAKKKESGEIGYAGFSFHDDYACFESIIDAWEWDVCQIQYNFMDVDEQAGTRGLRRAYDKGVGVIVMEPLLGGNLVDAPEPVAEIWNRSAHKEWTPVERALRWAWDQKEVGMILSGMSSMAHVTENLKIASDSTVDELSPAERGLFDEARVAYQGLKAIGCTACDYCKPCPQGVNIPRNFGLFNKASMYANIDAARGQYRWLLTEFEKGLSKNDTRALHCISCGECEPKCPQKLKIGTLMPEVAAFLGGEKSMDKANI